MRDPKLLISLVIRKSLATALNDEEFGERFQHTFRNVHANHISLFAHLKNLYINVGSDIYQHVQFSDIVAAVKKCKIKIIPPQVIKENKSLLV